MAVASAEKAIRDKVSAWAKTVGSKDANTAGSFFDDDVVTFDLAPPLQHNGFDRAALEAWFKTWKGPIGYEPTEVRSRCGLLQRNRSFSDHRSECSIGLLWGAKRTYFGQVAEVRI